jgi:hypothetical protein
MPKTETQQDIKTPEDTKCKARKNIKRMRHKQERYERHERDVGQWHGGAPGSRSLHASIALVLRVGLACWQGCRFLGSNQDPLSDHTVMHDIWILGDIRSCQTCWSLESGDDLRFQIPVYSCLV